MPTSADHWSEVYQTKPAHDVSWYQADPTVSLRLLTSLQPRPASVIDVGAGASVLVDALIDAFIDDAHARAAGPDATGPDATGPDVPVLDITLLDITLLDVSQSALDVVRRRLAGRDRGVTYLVADIVHWSPQRQWDAWHDRAVFHFLVDAAQRAAYVDTASRAVAPGGALVIGAFALDGPQQCSGLPTARYDADGLAAAFGHAFTLEHTEREVHRTPGGADQAFTWVVLRRRSEPAEQAGQSGRSTACGRV
jgi:SAM-dependent methyltransferase